MTLFYPRLKEYYQNIANSLKGDAKISGIFPNSSDVGTSREKLYIDFLVRHLPSKCNTFLGGFLFGENGDVSKQIDIIISTDTVPQYNFSKDIGSGKAFSPIEGCLAIASIKSSLDKNQLFDALDNIASIPYKGSLEGKINPSVRIDNYTDWPYKIIYASNGPKGSTVLNHINDFYKKNSTIPINKRPNIIHVIGKYVIFRINTGAKLVNIFDGTEETCELGGYRLFETNSDIQAIGRVLKEIQERAVGSSHILYRYDYILNNVISIQ